MRKNIEFNGTPSMISKEELEEITWELFLLKAKLSEEETTEMRELQKEIY